MLSTMPPLWLQVEFWHATEGGLPGECHSLRSLDHHHDRDGCRTARGAEIHRVELRSKLSYPTDSAQLVSSVWSEGVKIERARGWVVQDLI